MNWHKVKGKCPVCDHPGYCTRTSDGMVIKCMRLPNDRPVKQKDGAVGYLYKATDAVGGNLPKLPDAKEPPRRSVSEWKNIVKRHQSAVNPVKLEALSKQLNLSVKSLRLYGVGIDVGGYDGSTGNSWWSFPMYGGDGKICGVRLRSSDGKKCCIPGSKNGLFMPVNYEAVAIPEGICSDESPMLMVLPEGPTSAAACADMGFRAVGRPNNQLGGGQLLELLANGPPQDVIVLADDEGTKWTGGIPYWPGWEGAIKVAGLIREKCGRLRVCRLKDENGNRIKDPRDWLAGRHPLELMASIFGSQEDATIPWLNAKKAEVEIWRKKLHGQEKKLEKKTA